MATYYVRPTNGSDVAAGTSFATAFKTFQVALDTVAAADTIVLVPEATETTTVQIDWDGAAGTLTNPINVYVGNTSDGTRDDSLYYTIQLTSSATSLLNVANTFGDYHVVRGLILDANSNASHALFLADGAPVASTWINCKFLNATTANFRSAVTGQINQQLIACEAYGGVDGFRSDNSDGPRYLFCSAHDNTGIGFTLDNAGQTMIGCVAYDNGGDGIEIDGAGDVIMIGCVSQGNTGDGLSVEADSERLTIFNCIFADNGGYGINWLHGSEAEANFCDYNCYNLNTSGSTNGTVGPNAVESDPLFASTTDGSEDFTLGASSPCRNAGPGALLSSPGGLWPHIGHLDLASAGGGGGGLKLVGAGGLVG